MATSGMLRSVAASSSPTVTLGIHHCGYNVNRRTLLSPSASTYPNKLLFRMVNPCNAYSMAISFLTTKKIFLNGGSDTVGTEEAYSLASDNTEA